MQNKIAASTRNWLRITSVPPRDHDGPDEGGEEQDGNDFERYDVGREDGVGDGRGLADVEQSPAACPADDHFLLAERLDEECPEHAGEEEADDRRLPSLVVVEFGLAAHRRAGEHD